MKIKDKYIPKSIEIGVYYRIDDKQRVFFDYDEMEDEFNSILEGLKDKFEGKKET